MEPIMERCAGLDVHQETVVACVMYGPLDQRPKKEIQTFSTTTKGLLELADWLTERACMDVAMESTGVYWKPVWNVLEQEFRITLGNAQRIKNIPGRKTDVKDAEWICRLMRCGMIPASLVPPRDIREARDLTRRRRKLVQMLTSEKNRVHKVLQDANIKLTTYVTDLFGVSGRALLEKLINGEVLTEEQVREIAKGKLKKKVPQLVEAMNGRVNKHHRKMLARIMKHYDFLKEEIAELEQEIQLILQPYQHELELLDTIPGINQDGAADILAEIGPDMSAFETEHHLASWATVSPGQNESAGKKKKTGTGKGNNYLKTALNQAANASIRSKDTRLGNFYRSVLKRQGHKKAVGAVSHLIIRIAYHMLQTGTPYQEMGDRFVRKKKEPNVNTLIKRIEQLGYNVQLIQ
ncbi:IS110 family transposase [Paenibacillus montaniterrae]|uniref:IS110 family transposase n=1 Tax=Paenibacillus montaniterrae TaxID=429341 RepID=A0A919YL32_9BACL|nr:IS110 family transposase [Paenibacillus montaniterrae]GIP16397.1 IS110 family transposase [Paenibacillus montaniterrae]